MNTYYITNFPGHYPVGTAAIVVAGDRIEAFALLRSEAKKRGLDSLDWKDVGPKDFVSLNTNMRHCVILKDGDY